MLQGVHQGGPLSMKMYIAFNNDLLDILCNVNGGAGIHNTSTSLACPAFADDVSLVTLYKPNMQLMIDAAYRHSCKWQYEFNPKKSSVIICGRDMCPTRHLCLGEHVINVVESDTHLGIPLVNNPAKLIAALHTRINIGRRNVYAALSMGSRR